AAARNELVEDHRERIDDQGQMPVVVEEVRAGTRNVAGEPLAVAVRDHAVVGPLPDMDRAPDRVELEAPRADDPEVVIEPDEVALAEALVGIRGEILGEGWRDRSPIDVVYEVAEARGDVLWLHVAKDLPLLFDGGSKRVLAR